MGDGVVGLSTKFGPRGIWPGLIALLLAAGTFLPASGQCPGTLHTAASTYAYAFSEGLTTVTMRPLFDFIGTGGCTTSMSGANPPTACNQFRGTESPGFTAALSAVWPGSVSNVAGNCCVFNCAEGSCKVCGGDGLPVELMGFAVDGAPAE